VLGLAFLAGVIGVAVVDRSDRGPSAWDPRLADLVTFVESTRERNFDHPVEIRFATDVEIDDELVGDDDADWSEWAEIEEGRYRAQGLAEGDFDVLAAYDEQLTTFTVAFYDPDTRVMWVPTPDDPDAELPVMLRVTIVHELVHALQDQMGTDVFGYTSGDDSVRQAFIEGDATEVEGRYVDALTDEDYAEYLSQWDDPDGTSFPDLSDSPAAVDAEFGAPYYLGSAAVAAIVEERGWSAIDAILADPPWSMDAYFDPLDFVTTDPDDYEFAREPNIPDSLIEWGGSTGPVLWYLTFNEFLPAADAFEAARDWSSDRYLIYRDDDLVCVAWNVLTDSGDPAGPFNRAVQEWTRRAEGRSASTNPRQTQIESCDPGTTADLDLQDDFNTLLAYAEIVIRVESFGASTGVDAATARCTAHDWLATALPRPTDGIIATAEAIASTFDTTSCRTSNPYVTGTG
jgi:hypothetical protein